MKVPEAVRVQCTRQTKDLLKRAGVRRPGWGDFYGVRVRLNPRFSRLELA